MDSTSSTCLFSIDRFDCGQRREVLVAEVWLSIRRIHAKSALEVGTQNLLNDIATTSNQSLEHTVLLRAFVKDVFCVLGFFALVAPSEGQCR